MIWGWKEEGIIQLEVAAARTPKAFEAGSRTPLVGMLDPHGQTDNIEAANW